MSSILKAIENPFSSTEKKISDESTKIKNEVETDLKIFGDYALFALTVGILIGIPTLNYISKQIPAAIDTASKIAKIASPI